MHELVFFDREILYASEASIGALTSAALYGRGIFTTIAVRDGAPFLWEKHWHRLQKDSVALGFEIRDFSEDEILSGLHKTLSRNRVDRGRARITLFDGAAGALWNAGCESATHLLITAGEAGSISDKFSLTISPYRVNTGSPLAGVKSCNYLEHLMAHEEARSGGFEEAIRLNERGEVASACMANVFWVNGGKLFTPSLKTGCLSGTTREFVLENLECEEIETDILELQTADQIFLTSSGIGVVRVAAFDGRQLSAEPHQITQLLPKK